MYINTLQHHCEIEKRYVHKGENKNEKVQSEFVSLVLSSVYKRFPIDGWWELVYHWLIYILFISESQDSLIQ